MGWCVRYRIMMSYKKNFNSDPWYIPGMGSRNNTVSASFSLFYTIPFKHKEKEEKSTQVLKDYEQHNHIHITPESTTTEPN